MGRKSTVPYGLYRMHGFISAVDAAKTGFSEDDLNMLWEALLNAFEHDRSAARGEMNPRKLIVFKHESHLGNARAGELFERVKVDKKKGVELPRSWADYDVTIQRGQLPKGITLEEKL
jgi:CRISPR-associated protein Csd2